jgi:hypothetical protein
MPEATVLYSVTAAVVAGLVVWVAVVLKTAKEPWARQAAPAAAAENAAVMDPDTTAKATPVALGNTKPPVKDESAGA